MFGSGEYTVAPTIFPPAISFAFAVLYIRTGPLGTALGLYGRWKMFGVADCEPRWADGNVTAMRAIALAAARNAIRRVFIRASLHRDISNGSRTEHRTRLGPAGSVGSP